MINTFLEKAGAGLLKGTKTPAAPGAWSEGVGACCLVGPSDSWTVPMPFTSPGPPSSREVAGSMPERMSCVLPVSMWEMSLVASYLLSTGGGNGFRASISPANTSTTGISATTSMTVRSSDRAPERPIRRIVTWFSVP
ncbi:MAG: hypothetical protein ACO2O1_02270 [Candidatus Caldarchaeales archaeon]